MCKALCTGTGWREIMKGKHLNGKGGAEFQGEDMTEWPLRHCPCSYGPVVKVDRGMSVALHSSMSTASCLLGTAIWKDLAFVIRLGLHLPTMHSWKSDKDPVSNTGLGWWEEPAMISYHQHCHQRLSSPQESSFSIRLLLSSIPLSGNTGFFISAFLFICVSLGGGAELCHLRVPPSTAPTWQKSHSSMVTHPSRDQGSIWRHWNSFRVCRLSHYEIQLLSIGL